MKLQAGHVFGIVQIATGLVLVWVSYQWSEAREQADRAVEMLKQYQTDMDACLDQAEGKRAFPGRRGREPLATGEQFDSCDIVATSPLPRKS